MRDLAVRNARVWTGARLFADCAIVRDGCFAFVGREADANPPPGIEVLDARGGLVLPGFIDGHAHLLSTGNAMRSVDLKGVESVDEAVRRVTERAASAAPDEWISGAGWDQHLWPDARFPDRRALDAVGLENPVVLVHTSGHCLWVSTAALRAAGIDGATTPPPGGAIDLDGAGEPSGIVRDEAMALVYDAMPKPSRDERLAALREALAHAQSLGITGVHAMDVGAGELDALRALHNRGELHTRVRAFLNGRRLDGWAGTERTGDGDDTLRIGGVKFYADGALGSLTAWMHEPYEGSDDLGLALLAPDELERQVRRSLQHGLAPAVHAIGDRANTEVLNITERTRHVAPELPRRIEHAQLLSPRDIARFGALGVTASVQPVHATQDMTKVDRFWGERGRYAYAFASLLRAGAALAFGSDSPVETMDPLAGVHAAVTRRNASGEPPNGWYPHERVSLETALTAYTTGCASATREDGALGRIAAGCHADFVVLSRDLFALDDSMDVLDARVELTVAGGEIVYRRGET